MILADQSALEALLGATGPDNVATAPHSRAEYDATEQAERAERKKRRRARQLRLKASSEQRSAANKKVEEIEAVAAALKHEIQCIRTVQNDNDFVQRSVAGAAKVIADQLQHLNRLLNYRVNGHEIIDDLKRKIAEINRRVTVEKGHREVKRFESLLSGLDPKLLQLLSRQLSSATPASQGATP